MTNYESRLGRVKSIRKSGEGHCCHGLSRGEAVTVVTPGFGRG